MVCKSISKLVGKIDNRHPSGVENEQIKDSKITAIN